MIELLEIRRRVERLDVDSLGRLDGQLIEGTPEPFFNDLASQPSLRDSGADYKASIESIHVTGNVASAVLRETGFGPFSFTDYFHLLKMLTAPMHPS